MQYTLLLIYICRGTFPGRSSHAYYYRQQTSHNVMTSMYLLCSCIVRVTLPIWCMYLSYVHMVISYTHLKKTKKVLIKMLCTAMLHFNSQPILR